MGQASACIGRLSQVTKAIDITDSRPLSAALDALEAVSGTTINYEDPPCQNVADVQDVSTPTQRAASPGYQLLVPRIGNVTAQVLSQVAGSVSAADAVADVNLLLSSYRNNTLPGDFKVEQANGMTYVTPTNILSAGGSMISVTSPMMTPITVPNARRSVAETATAIFDAVYHATGLRIVVGSFPFLPTESVSFGATGEPARDALARLFLQMGRQNLSYRLSFDPTPDKMRIFDYMINVQPTGNVSPMAPSGLGPIVAPSPSTTTSSQQPAKGSSPFFKVKQ